MNDYSDYIAEQEEKYDEIHSYQNGKETKKCSSCCVFRTMNYYGPSRTGRELKTCDKCRNNSQKYKEKKLKKKEDNPARKFINEVLQYREDHKDNDTDDWRLKDIVSATELYNKYNDWCIQNNKANITQTKFGRSISNLLHKKRTKKGIFYTF